MSYSTQLLNKRVMVKIDRPIGSRHPHISEIHYTQNYGYILGVMAPDGEELDAYVLGVSEPIDEFEGICIAVIHRINDEDDKLVVVPEGKNFTDDEIRALTCFQEKFFHSVIIRSE